MSCEIWMAGGGTGGHLIPGLAVADALRRQRPAWKICFRHAGRSVDLNLLAGDVHAASAGVPPLRMRPSVLLQYGRAYFRARRELRGGTPKLVIGLGGYASFPHVRAAQDLGLPTVLFEANVLPGHATRHLLKRAWKLCCPWPEASLGMRLRPGQLAAWGLPIRPPARLSQKAALRRLGFAEDQRLLLVTGGSQGARPLNQFLSEAARFFASEQIAVLHLAGSDDVTELRETYSHAGVVARVCAFLEDMPAAYRAAHAVLCRAGGATLAELAAHRLPAIVVPYPFAKDDHQTANARAAEAHGGAVCTRQDELGPATLQTLSAWFASPSAQKAQAERWEPLSYPQAAETCAGDLIAALEAEMSPRPVSVAEGAPLRSALEKIESGSR